MIIYILSVNQYLDNSHIHDTQRNEDAKRRKYARGSGLQREKQRMVETYNPNLWREEQNSTWIVYKIPEIKITVQRNYVESLT